MIRWLAGLLDRLIDWLAPVDTRTWADELADWEANHDVYEPGEQ